MTADLKIPSETGGLIRLPQVLALFPVGRSTWWAGVRDGKYPAPIKLGPRTTAWLRADIEMLIASLSTQREHSQNVQS